MATQADDVRKQLGKRGYRVVKDTTSRGRSSWLIYPPTGQGDMLLGKFPVNPKPGSWRRNLLAGINRWERGGPPPRSNRLPVGRKTARGSTPRLV